MTAWTVPSYAEWTVPGYTEERQLGHGVSGRVVAAVNNASGQRTAIKYFHKNLVDDTGFLGELRSEAQQLVTLDAPHVVRVLDYVEEPREGAAIVMELVDGVSLREMLARRGPLSAAAALVVLRDSLLALAAAHSRRLPHRDVKPDNVLIDASGWCTLTDFGVAVKTDKQMPAAGTPEYMAPELWHGAPNVPATDIYAATATLCESLTGKPPFSGRSRRLRGQHESTPVPLDKYDPPLQDLIAWGLAKDPQARPASAMSFVSELDARAAAAYGSYWEEQGRRELAERAAGLPLHEGGTGGGSARVTRLARRKVLAFVSVAAVVLVTLLGAGAVALFKTSGHQAQLSSVSASAVDAEVSVTPPVVVSKCTTPATFTFTGTITDLQPGPVSYQWLYSSGKPGPVRTLNFTSDGQQQVSGGKITTSTAGDGWAQLKVLLNPGAVTSGKVTYSLLCSTANSDIAVSAKVKPAALTFSSCSAPHPTLTATGTITSKNAGTVSFYWAMSDGEKTTPVQLTFNAAGTQAANPLTFPVWVPASGNVVLVVTKPAVAASKPAAYKVSCGPSATPGAPSNATSPAATSSSVKPSVSPKASTAAPTIAAPTTAATSPTNAPTTSKPTTTPTTSPPTTTPTTSSPTAAPTTAAPTPTLTTTSASPPTTTPGP